MQFGSGREHIPGESYRDDWEWAVNGPKSADARSGSALRFGGYANARPPIQQMDAGSYTGYQGQSYASVPVASTYQGQAYIPMQAPAYQGQAYAQVEPPAKKGKRRPMGCYVFLSWAALFAWAAFIFYMSSHTSSDLAQGVFAHVREYIEQFVWTYYGYVEDPVSPICHFAEYFILGALLGNALHCHMPLIPATVLAVLVASGYGVTDEIHQIYVDGRYADIEDWKIDTAAAAVGSVLSSFVYYMFPKKRVAD